MFFFLTLLSHAVGAVGESLLPVHVIKGKRRFLVHKCAKPQNHRAQMSLTEEHQLPPPPQQNSSWKEEKTLYFVG